ncbi:phospholipase A and acyltransferase 3-like [Synchiropus splendidus]|uniref:phospholipase A and acyltransferase 3-like n=1 Tax=Synchiropus splendidus TaxID=270530 RepID=UPI00237D5E02|nr:phospholipase A and acyltransferase 3-like [Synchiropus splendidus]
MSSSLKAGDLVEIKRPLYEHWGVYVGDGFIVHLASHPDVPAAVSSSVMASSSSVWCMVKKEQLSAVAKNNPWRIANDLDGKRNPRPAHVIVQDACALVGQTMTYKLTTSNCEHFANKLRYDMPVSLQVVTGTVGLLASITMGLGLLATVGWMITRHSN